MKRAFIFGFLEFPRGSASANYVQNLALALRECGYEPWVISSGDTRECQWDNIQKCHSFCGINFVPYLLSSNKLKHYIEFHFLLGTQVVKHLKALKCCSEDIIVAYSLKPSEIEPVLKFAKKNHVTSIACVTELFPPEYFPLNTKDPGWWEYKRLISHSLLMADKLWPISRYIENHFAKFGCDMYVIPPMINIKSISCNFDLRQKGTDVIKFVFPGNRGIKDAVLAMAQAVAHVRRISDREFEFHVTGIKKDFFDGHKEVEDLIGTTIILHNWMDYETLQKFYAQMDFLFLAREVNPVTLANFPSKVPEVMAFGVIPVVSDVGEYTSYYLENGKNSVIFDGASVASCLNAICRVLEMSSNEMQTMSINARRFAEKRFDYHNWIEGIRAHINGA